MLKVGINYINIINELKKIENEYQVMENTYLEVKKCFNEIRQSQMEGKSINVMIKICDKWDRINIDRLNKINDIKVMLNYTINEYKNVISEIEKMTGGVGNG